MRNRSGSRLVLSVALLVAALGPTAAADRPGKFVRVAKAKYQASGLSIPGAPALDLCEPLAIGCVTFRSRSGEGFVNIDIEDDSGGYVLGVISVDGNPMETFCSTSHPLIPLLGREVQVSVFNGPSTDPLCPSVATSGLVIARFMNAP